MCAKKEKEITCESKVRIESQARAENLSSSVLKGNNGCRTKEFVYLYDAILRNIQVGLDVWCLQNAENPTSFRLIFSNNATEQLTGTSVKHVLGKSLKDVYPGAVNAGFAKSCANIIRSGKAKFLGEIPYRAGHMVAGP